MCRVSHSSASSSNVGHGSALSSMTVSAFFYFFFFFLLNSHCVAPFVSWTNADRPYAPRGRLGRVDGDPDAALGNGGPCRLAACFMGCLGPAVAMDQL